MKNIDIRYQLNLIKYGIGAIIFVECIFKFRNKSIDIQLTSIRILSVFDPFPTLYVHWPVFPGQIPEHGAAKARQQMAPLPSPAVVFLED